MLSKPNSKSGQFGGKLNYLTVPTLEAFLNLMGFDFNTRKQGTHQLILRAMEFSNFLRKYFCPPELLSLCISQFIKEFQEKISPPHINSWCVPKIV